MSSPVPNWLLSQRARSREVRRTLLSFLQFNHIVGSRVMEMVWQIFDQAHAKLVVEKLDESCQNWTQPDDAMGRA